VVGDGFDGATGQHRAQGECHVGRLPHFIDRHRDHSRQALAAEFRRERHGVPAGFTEQLVGFLEARRRRDNAILAGRANGVATAVDRVEYAAGELGGFVKNRFDEIDGTFLIAWQGTNVGEAGHFVEDELHVANRCDVIAHVLSPECF
jgi:hypothetical protein